VKKKWLIGVAATFALIGTVRAQNVDCDPAHSEALYNAVMSSSNWPTLQKTFAQGGKCVSSSVVEPWEAFTEKVGDLMANHWDQFGEFDRLSRKYPDFREFVLGRLRQETLGQAQAVQIRDKAKSSCPKGSTALCAEVHKAVQSNLGEKP
jgi:hypothetical protein